MPIHLHGLPGTRSTRASWLLEELGFPLEHTQVEKVWPPDREGPMIESAAVCMALADQYADKNLAPALGSPARARYYEAIVYAVSTLDETVIPIYFHKKVLPEPNRDSEVIEAKMHAWHIAADLLTKHLGDRNFIASDAFTAADVVVGYDLILAREVGLLDEHPKLRAYTESLLSRPAVKHAFA